MSRADSKPDNELLGDVLAELARSPRISGSEIAASVKHGAVTLHGLVLTVDERICAELAVNGIDGVRAVANDIQVKSPEEMLAADESVAERVARVLTWYSSLRNMDVKAKVDDGHITLTGQVDLPYQKAVVADRVAELEGVSGVTNRIKLRRRSTDE